MLEKKQFSYSACYSKQFDHEILQAKEVEMKKTVFIPVA